MESLRDVKRVMEREIAKGSCPLQFEWLEFGEKPLQFIVILSILVDTFFSRISLTMLPVPNLHNTSCVLS